jgi:hypothetical protein
MKTYTQQMKEILFSGTLEASKGNQITQEGLPFKPHTTT